MKAVGIGDEDTERWCVRKWWGRSLLSRGGRGSASQYETVHWTEWTDLERSRSEAKAFHDAEIQPGRGTCV